MNASSFFAITVSALLGLGAVGGARYAGLFEKPEAKPEPKPVPVKVLVAGENLFENMTVVGTQVRVRELRADEMALYQKNKDKFMPAVPNAAHMRIAARHIEADTPLLREHFVDQSLPDELSSGIPLHMRAVNLQLPKERCSGGLLRVGEYVDVFLTCQIVGAEDKPAVLQTACVARGVKILVKRNNPWQMMTANTSELPISFTLLANSYRAGLLEFSKLVGNITLMPSPPPAEFQIRNNRQPGAVFSDTSSAEYRDEDERVERVQRSELTIGYRDLERLFKLPPIPVARVEPKPDTILHYNGLAPHRVTLLPSGAVKQETKPAETPISTNPDDPANKYDRPALGYRFYRPDVTILGKANGASDCPECDEAKKKAQLK